MFPTLRQVMEDLERAGDLRRIDAPVDPNQELAALLSLTESGPATVATRVVGSPFPVVANLVNSRDRLARSVGLNTGALTDALIGAVARPVPPVPAPGPAPVQTVVCEPRLDRLPVPRFFELETGPYITGGVTLVRDAVNGQRNLSFARYKVLSATRAMLGVSPNHHLGQMARRAQAVGQDLPVAVAIGVHPAIMLAACLYLGFGEDELECAGALMGGPVETVPGVSVDVAVPAGAEIVLEGLVRTSERVREGLVSEFHGRYHDYGDGYLVDFTAMTHRAEPYFQVILPGLHQEHLLLGGVSIAAGLKAALCGRFPGLVDVAVPAVAGGRTAAVVAVDGLGGGDARRLIEAVMSQVRLIRQVVLVDGQVDPWSAEAVEWARLVHVRPERDLVVLPASPTDRSDPLARDFKVGKLGVDATAKAGDRVEGWAFARPAAAADRAARAILQAEGIRAEQSPLLAGIRYPPATEAPVTEGGGGAR